MEASKQLSFSILVVEDDELIRDLFQTLISLEFPDAPLYVAGNGKEGLNLFKEHAPALVITDINMPVMDGIQMAREIRSIKANAWIIVISAYVDDEDNAGKFKEIAFNDVLVKPIKFDLLCAAIKNCHARFTLEDT